MKGQQSHSEIDKVRGHQHPFLLKRLLIPMTAALLTWYTVHLFLHDVISGPWVDVAIHPFTEVIAELIVPIGYFALARYRLTWFVISLCVAAMFALILWLFPKGSIPALLVFGLFGGLTWGGAGLLLFGLFYRRWTEEEMEQPLEFNPALEHEKGYAVGTGVQIFELDEEGIPIYPEEMQNRIGTALVGGALYVILCVLGTLLVGLLAWKYFDASFIQSVIALSIAAVLATIAPFITYKFAAFRNKYIT